MSEDIHLFGSLFAGGLLGLIFFGGLWFTIRRAVFSQNPGMWFLLSLISRMSLAVAGFYVVSSGSWKRLLACLVGFLAGRILLGAFFRGFPGVDLALKSKGTK